MKNTKWTDEEKQNVVGVFKILLDMDRKQNPHLYGKKKLSEINRNYTEEQLNNSSPIMSENSKI